MKQIQKPEIRPSSSIMAEGVPPGSMSHQPSLPPLPSRSKIQQRSNNSIAAQLPPSLPLASFPRDDPLFQPGTYVVQVPKEQILRAPPSENASIAEQFRHKTHHRRRNCLCCLCCLVSILLFALLILGAFFYLLRIPTFALEKLVPESYGYNLKLRSHNPSTKLGYCFEAGGNVELSNRGRIVSIGETSVFCQPPSSTTTFKLKTRGSSTKGITKLMLSIEVPVRFKVRKVQSMRMGFKFNCNVTLEGLGSINVTRIVSQRCRSDVHWIIWKIGVLEVWPRST